ncbi:hypothetical protein E1B28_001907 [Marasmius oreades]|uniref:Uncharacterized protein n=1 Tax=Marasmius oreades TaxID=181124 RepID=A0A9P7V4K2_9AGAR|nr:uncharacterized protein E1B28_001907 [Marasmius oreades]KAG7100127.1 hypothetical protein E1B28_001907 [Marasmius oreades]
MHPKLFADGAPHALLHSSNSLKILSRLLLLLSIFSDPLHPMHLKIFQFLALLALRAPRDFLLDFFNNTMSLPLWIVLSLGGTLTSDLVKVKDVEQQIVAGQRRLAEGKELDAETAWLIEVDNQNKDFEKWIQERKHSVSNEEDSEGNDFESTDEQSDDEDSVMLWVLTQEECKPFKIIKRTKGNVSDDDGEVEVKRLVAREETIETEIEETGSKK